MHRRQAASYQTTCNPLKKLDFVGADRAAFRLSAKRPVHPTHMRWLKHCIRGQVRSHECLLRDSATSKTWWRLPQERVHSADYVLYDKRRLAGDLPGTGSKTCTRGVSDAIWGRCAAHRCRRNLRELPRPPGRLTCISINYRVFDKRRRFISGFY